MWAHYYYYYYYPYIVIGHVKRAQSVTLAAKTLEQELNVTLPMLVKWNGPLDRIAEHLWPSSVEKSEVTTHIHKVIFLGKDQDWHRWGVRKAIYICVNKPDLNCDQDRFHLPHSWDHLLQSCMPKVGKPQQCDHINCDQDSS